MKYVVDKKEVNEIGISLLVMSSIFKCIVVVEVKLKLFRYRCRCIMMKSLSWL